MSGGTIQVQNIHQTAGLVQYANAANVLGAKDMGAYHTTNNSSTRKGHTLNSAQTGTTAQSRDKVEAFIEALGLTTQAPANPCRATTEAGECILFKEIPLVYSNDESTIVALNGSSIIKRVRVQRTVLDQGAQGHVATTFCGDPATSGLSSIFYTLGYAGGRAACSAAALLPTAVLFGQFSSEKLNNATWLTQSGEHAAYNAFQLAALYGGGSVSDSFSNMASGGRLSFINYMGSYAGAAFASACQRNLSVYAIQFPVGVVQDVADDCSCATVNCGGPSDAELTNSNLHFVIDTESFTFHPIKGGPPVACTNLYTDAGDNYTDF